MSDAESPQSKRGRGRPRKEGPSAAELRGSTIHPVVKKFTAWRVKNGLSQKKAGELLQALHFPLTSRTIRNWEEGWREPRPHMVAILEQILDEHPEIKK
jgi:DNA-binding transcriptional regulator YiaG